MSPPHHKYNERQFWAKKKMGGKSNNQIHCVNTINYNFKCLWTEESKTFLFCNIKSRYDQGKDHKLIFLKLLYKIKSIAGNEYYKGAFYDHFSDQTTAYFELKQNKIPKATSLSRATFLKNAPESKDIYFKSILKCTKMFYSIFKTILVNR